MKKKKAKMDMSLAARNIRATLAGGMRTGNYFSRKSEPVHDPRFKRANINAWAPHPPVNTKVPHRTANPVFPKLKRGAKILRAVAR